MHKARVLASALLAFAFVSSSAGEGKPQPRLTFTSIPIAQDLGTTKHKVLPYQHEDQVFVIVVDPIMCGQRPVNPRYEIQDGTISLHYDLTAAPAGARQGCTAHSIFELQDVPHGGFQVEFSAGKERVRSGAMMRCPVTEATADIWDCIKSAR